MIDLADRSSPCQAREKKIWTSLQTKHPLCSLFARPKSKKQCTKKDALTSLGKFSKSLVLRKKKRVERVKTRFKHERLSHKLCFLVNITLFTHLKQGINRKKQEREVMLLTAQTWCSTSCRVFRCPLQRPDPSCLMDDEDRNENEYGKGWLNQLLQKLLLQNITNRSFSSSIACCLFLSSRLPPRCWVLMKMLGTVYASCTQEGQVNVSSPQLIHKQWKHELVVTATIAI